MSTKETGDLGETIAARFLEMKGFQIVVRNYRKSWGEIDIIAVKSGMVRFIEVKSVTRPAATNAEFSRETGEYRPEAKVHPQKLLKIARTAETYMAETGDQREYQIDVVAVFLDPSVRKARCRLLENVTL